MRYAGQAEMQVAVVAAVLRAVVIIYETSCTNHNGLVRFKIMIPHATTTTTTTTSNDGVDDKQEDGISAIEQIWTLAVKLERYAKNERITER